MTKSQVDRLGVRLRAGEITDADFRLLDEYRQSFAGAYDQVMRRLRDEFGLTPTGRAAKSTFAILGKLRRESARLSQIQDVAGCRVVVPDTPAQDELVRTLESAFERVTTFDRRERPTHGYRAVHLVVTTGEDKAVEIQVRTTAQQLWAEISEKLADRFGIEVKYGRGEQSVRTILDAASDSVGAIGRVERSLALLLQHRGDAGLASPEVATAIDLPRQALESALEFTPRMLRLMLDLVGRL